MEKLQTTNDVPLAASDVVEALQKAGKKYDLSSPQEILAILAITTIVSINLMKGKRSLLEKYIEYLRGHLLEGESDD